MKKLFYIALLLISVILISIKLINELRSLGVIVSRSNLEVEWSESVEESKQKGAFMFEYTTDSIIIYDSVYVRIREAFAEHRCVYDGYYTKKYHVSDRFSNLIIDFEPSDPWPGVYYREEDDWTKCWAFRPRFHKIFKRNGITRFINSEIPEDTVYIYLTEEYRQDNKWVNGDTLGCLKLIRKLPE